MDTTLSRTSKKQKSLGQAEASTLMPFAAGNGLLNTSLREKIPQRKTVVVGGDRLPPGFDTRIAAASKAHITTEEKVYATSDVMSLGKKPLKMDRGGKGVHRHEKTQNMLLSRKERHDSAINDYKEEWKRICSDIEERVGEITRSFREKCNDSDSAIRMLFEQLEDEQLGAIPITVVENIWRDIKGELELRDEFGRGLYGDLLTLEEERRERAQDELSRLLFSLKDIAHESEGVCERIVEDLSAAANAILLSNKQAHADFTARFSKQVVEKEKAMKEKWRQRLEAWRSFRHRSAIDSFKATLETAAFSNPAERIELTKRVKERQAEFASRRLDLLAQLEEKLREKMEGSVEVDKVESESGGKEEKKVTIVEPPLDEEEKEKLRLEKLEKLKRKKVTSERILSFFGTSAAQEWSKQVVETSEKYHLFVADVEGSFDQIEAELMRAVAEERQVLRKELEIAGFVPEDALEETIEKEVGSTIKERERIAEETKVKTTTALTMQDKVTSARLDNLARYTQTVGSLVDKMEEQISSTAKGVLKDAADTRRGHEAQDEDKEERLHRLIVAMNQCSDEEKLDVLLKDALKILEEIERGYRNFTDSAVKQTEAGVVTTKANIEAITNAATTMIGIEMIGKGDDDALKDALLMAPAPKKRRLVGMEILRQLGVFEAFQKWEEEKAKRAALKSATPEKKEERPPTTAGKKGKKGAKTPEKKETAAGEESQQKQEQLMVGRKGREAVRNIRRMAKHKPTAHRIFAAVTYILCCEEIDVQTEMNKKRDEEREKEKQRAEEAGEEYDDEEPKPFSSAELAAEALRRAEERASAFLMSFEETNKVAGRSLTFASTLAQSAMGVHITQAMTVAVKLCLDGVTAEAAAALDCAVSGEGEGGEEGEDAFRLFSLLFDWVQSIIRYTEVRGFLPISYDGKPPVQKKAAAGGSKKGKRAPTPVEDDEPAPLPRPAPIEVADENEENTPTFEIHSMLFRLVRSFGLAPLPFELAPPRPSLSRLDGNDGEGGEGEGESEKKEEGEGEAEEPAMVNVDDDDANSLADPSSLPNAGGGEEGGEEGEEGEGGKGQDSASAVAESIEALVAPSRDDGTPLVDVTVISFGTYRRYFEACTRLVLTHLHLRLDDAVSDAKEKARQTVESLTEELDERLRAHRPRAGYTELEVHQVRALALDDHIARFERHRRLFRHKQRVQKRAFEEALEAARNSSISFRDRLEAILVHLPQAETTADLSGQKRGASRVIKEFKRQVVEEHGEKLKRLARDNHHVLVSMNAGLKEEMKAIAEGGDYAAEELERFGRRLGDLDKEADAEKGECEKAIEGVEGEGMKAAEDALHRVDEVYKINEVDLNLLEKVAKYIQEVENRISLEKTRSDSAAKELNEETDGLNAAMKVAVESATKRGTAAADVPIPGLDESDLLIPVNVTPTISRGASGMSMAGRSSSLPSDEADPSSPSSAANHTPLEVIEMFNRLMRMRRFAYRRASYLQALSTDLQDSEILVDVEGVFEDKAEFPNEGEGEESAKPEEKPVPEEVVAKAVEAARDRFAKDKASGAVTEVGVMTKNIEATIAKSLEAANELLKKYYETREAKDGEEAKEEITRPEKIPPTFADYIQRIKARLDDLKEEGEELREAEISSFRAQAMALDATLAKLPYALYTALAAQARQTGRVRRREKGRRWTKASAALEKKRKHHTAALTPSLGSLNRRSELNELCDAEKGRQDRLLATLGAYESELVAVMKFGADFFTYNVRLATALLLTIYDSVPLPRTLVEAKSTAELQRASFRRRMAVVAQTRQAGDNGAKPKDDRERREWDGLDTTLLVVPDTLREKEGEGEGGEEKEEEQGGRPSNVSNAGGSAPALSSFDTPTARVVIRSRGKVFEAFAGDMKDMVDTAKKEVMGIDMEATRWHGNWDTLVSSLKQD